jgi:hypothetical protein
MLPIAYEANVAVTRRTKKTDVAEHPKAFHHVGLLDNEPPDLVGLFFM